jgi:hypothetical protein
MLRLCQLNVTQSDIALGGLMAIVIANGPKIREFRPGREQWNFMGDKNP